MSEKINNLPLSEFDKIKLSFTHIKLTLVAGAGFLTDAYDLFSISIVLYILTVFPEKLFPISIKVLGLPLSAYLATSAILFAIIGQLIFGSISDILGRKRIYGIEAAILSIGAILSAISPNIYWLIFSRALLGLGIGGDYPVSSVIASEYGNTKDRGKMIATVFSTQGLGIILAVFIGILSVQFLPPDLAWRTVLGVAAIPAFLVIYFRRTVPETPRYSFHVKKDVNELNKAAEYLNIKTDIKNVNSNVQNTKQSFSNFIKKYWKYLLITTSTWFILDIAFYGTGIYSSFISSSIIPHLTQENIKTAIFIIGLPYLVGLPGYFSAVALIDKVGRKSLQIIGFLAMTIIYFLTGFMIKEASYFVITFLLFALSFYAINLGPNTTTFVIPAEIFPTHKRSTGHGISAASGKLGAAISTLYLPLWKAQFGLSAIFLGLGVISMVGAVLTTYLPEPKGISLEEVSQEEVISAPVKFNS